MQGKKTPLYDLHLASGAKLMEFGGWVMPVQYSGIIEEHQAVRQKAGLFDVSHMGEILVTGDSAAEFINSVITNDVAKIAVNQALYSPMCYPTGGVVDDLLVYRLEEKKYLLAVNAGNIEKDFLWLEEQAKNFAVILENISDQTAEVALQGPLAQSILQQLTDTDLTQVSYFWCKAGVSVGEIDCLISRTGYTGEDGFEIYCAAGQAVRLWQMLMDAGKDAGLAPVGLGARDTLRFEACLPLYGHELSEMISPLEAGLQPFVKLDKMNFVGRERLAEQKAQGVARKIVGLEMTGRGVARAGYPCLADGKVIGSVTSGTFAPTLGKNLALAILDSAHAGIGKTIHVEIRGKQVEAVIIPKPFYRRNRT